jgi:hypothetical protein
MISATYPVARGSMVRGQAIQGPVILQERPLVPRGVLLQRRPVSRTRRMILSSTSVTFITWFTV